MASDDVTDHYRDIFRQHERTMHSVAEQLRRAGALIARSRERLDSSAGSLERQARRAGDKINRARPMSAG